jgi:hypothetical protein
MKPRCIIIRLRSAREVAQEGERPVLTERREDAPVATPEIVEATDNTEATVTTGNDESSAEKATEETSTTVAMEERSQGVYASEASRPLTMREIFGLKREEERNTPEYLAEAKESYKEGKSFHMEYCRRKGIPH